MFGCMRPFLNNCHKYHAYIKVFDNSSINFFFLFSLLLFFSFRLYNVLLTASETSYFSEREEKETILGQYPRKCYFLALIPGYIISRM